MRAGANRGFVKEHFRPWFAMPDVKSAFMQVLVHVSSTPA